MIVGGGPAEARRRAGPCPPRCSWASSTGRSSPEIYASLDLFVHSGPRETFGQTLQEAAASGLPVVAPAAGGPLDLVSDGVTGFLVPPGDAGRAGRCGGRLAADPALRAAQGRAGRQKVLGRSWPALGDELIGHYEAVLRTAGSGGAVTTFVALGDSITLGVGDPVRRTAAWRGWAALLAEGLPEPSAAQPRVGGARAADVER